MFGEHGVEQRYEAPEIVVIGPIDELTLGGGSGGSADGSATYSPDSLG